MNLSKIFQVLVPKDGKFYPLFEQSSDNIVKAAILLNKLMLTEEISKRDIVIKEIKEIESAGDNVTHIIFEELNKTLITPFDREDIHKLASSLDDVLDYINSSAVKIRLYKPVVLPEELAKMSELILRAARELNNAIIELKNLKNPHKIKEACIVINEIENQADDIYHNFISDMFEKETNAIELIKKKEIILSLEKATDKAEDVSDVLKSIIVKLA